MKNQVLSKSQMRHLRDLGVDTQEASVVHLFKVEEENYIDYDEAETLREEIVVLDRYYDAEMGNYDHSLRMDYGVFTLQDLLDKLPHSITNDRLNGLTIEKLSNCWDVYYEVIGFINKEVIKSIRRETLLEAVYEMLCYLAENKLLEKERK